MSYEIQKVANGFLIGPARVYTQTANISEIHVVQGHDYEKLKIKLEELFEDLHPVEKK